MAIIKNIYNMLKGKNTQIVKFEYRYIGSIGGGSYTYTVERDSENRKTIFTLYEMERRGKENLVTEMESDFIDKLYSLYNKHKLHRWNGYYKSSHHILDGNGFSLYIKFANGHTISAHGSNSFPFGYRKFKEDLENLFSTPVEKLHEMDRVNKIKNGVKGELLNAMFSIVQYGTYGRNEYYIRVSKYDKKTCNIDINIKNKNGEFSLDSCRYYKSLPLDAIDMERFKSIIQECDIIQWTDYHKNSSDSINREWFQIDFSFEEGEILAYGSEPPENYDKFKTLFMQTTKEILDDLKQNYNLETDSDQ